MNYPKILIFSLCLISSSFIISSAYAAFPTSSTDMGTIVAAPKNNMINCPKITINGVTLVTSTQDINLGGADCQWQAGGSGGAAAAAGAGFVAAIGGYTNPSCPSDRPYLGGYSEVYAIVAGVGAIVNTPICCKTPTPPSAATAIWVQGNTCP